MRITARSVLPLFALTLLLLRPAGADAPAGDQTVPDVVGLQVADAGVLLQQAGFAFEVEAVLAPGVVMGMVLGQDPGGLAVRPTSTTVRVLVAGVKKVTAPTPPVATPPVAPPPPPPVAPPAEPAPVEPPPVAPPPAEPPAGEAPPSGLLPEPPSEEPAAAPSAGPPAEVPSSAPAEPPAAPVLPGLEEVPAEPAPDTNGPALPKAFGLSRQEAEQTLAGYQLLLEVTLTSPDMQGRVVEQHPMPGTNLALGQTVTLIFGLANEPGREYRQVPALEGLTPEKAQEKLSQAGYGVAWCSIPSPNDRAGLVVGTTPHRFSYLLKGEAVRVRIGRGTGEALPPPATEIPPVPPTPSTEQPPSGELPAPAEPVAPVEPPLPPPVEPTPAPSDPPAGPVAPPSEPPPSEPPPSEPPPSEPPAPPSEPPPSEPPPSEPPAPPSEPPPSEPPPVEPAPAEPAPAEPVPTEPAPTPFLPQPPRPAPGPVTLTGPADSDSFPRAYGPTFEWRTVPNADGYEWELEQETNGSWQAARTERLIGTKFRPARMEIGRYRWRVRALNGDVPGSWADYRLLFLY
jgi:beta-lactam-binding protein with PASTA domain